jgi:Caspase domain
MGFGFFNESYIQICWDFLSCYRPSTVIKPSSIPPTSGPFQKLGATHSRSSTKPLSLFALLIGINKYASSKVSNLEGAVSDALAVKTYLERDLDVPAAQIRLLTDAEATRTAIIQEFNNLIADQRIHHDDPILIFYAGHGGEVDPPMGWESGDAKIQMLIPHDFRTVVDGHMAYGIPDRTIDALLSGVAERWGDNIVCPIVRHYIVYATDDYMIRQSFSTAVTLDLATFLYQNPLLPHGLV